MKLYKIKFKGYWPVGAVALAVAHNIGSAYILMRKELETMGLEKDQILDIEQLNIDIKKSNEEQLIVLLDGSY